MAAKQNSTKKYVVKLSAEEREQFDTMIHVGKYVAQKLLKAWILLKADASEVGECWNDSQIAVALDTRRGNRGHDPPAPGGGRLRGRSDPQALTTFGQPRISDGATVKDHDLRPDDKDGIF